MESTQSSAAAPAPHLLRVVIIDDNADDRALTARALAGRFPGIQTRQVADPQGLAQVLQEDEFDAVITDYQLKWSTGLDVLRQVKARYPEVIVIMFTATGTQEVAVEAMREGLSDYVVKAPQHFIRLSASLQSALDHTRAQREARLALEARERFLTIAAHELRTPLTTINGTVEGVRLRLERLAPTLPLAARQEIAPLIQALDRARRQSARLDRLQEDIATAVRLDTTAALPVEMHAVDLVEVVRSGIAAQRELTPERTITLDAPERLLVRADSERLRQVVANLLGNALKFSANEVPVEVQVSREAEQDQEAARCAVRDQGPGIPLEEQERIWGYLYQRRELSYLSGSSVGLGLGLYIVRALVAQMEGTAGVESAPGQGSTFWFTLPLGTPEVSGA